VAGGVVHDLVTLEPALRRMTQLIVRCVDPDEVLLFGSVAKGRAVATSDVDLLVVGEFAGPQHRRGRELRGLLDTFPLSIDMHLLTRAEVDAAAAVETSWIATLLRYAVPLYRRGA
jgi:predicted nucleotidyltransferase